MTLSVYYVYSTKTCWMFVWCLVPNNFGYEFKCALFAMMFSSHISATSAARLSINFPNPFSMFTLKRISFGQHRAFLHWQTIAVWEWRHWMKVNVDSFYCFVNKVHFEPFLFKNLHALGWVHHFTWLYFNSKINQM